MRCALVFIPPPPRSRAYSPLLTISFSSSSTSCSGSPAEIKAATIYRIVQRMTDGRVPDTHLINYFLLSFQGIMTSIELLEVLERRFLSEVSH